MDGLAWQGDPPRPLRPAPDAAAGYLADLVESLLDADMPTELRQLGRTLRTWKDQIVARHRALISNGATEAMNSLIKWSSVSGSGSDASATTGYASCSTPEPRTGNSSHTHPGPTPVLKRHHLTERARPRSVAL